MTMSLLGFIMNVFIFLSMFGTKCTKSIKGGCEISNQNEIKVCKGDSTVLKRNHDCPIKDPKNLKFFNETSGKWKRIKTTDGTNKYEKKSNSTLVLVNNITEDDTGLYRYRQTNPRVLCCVRLKITNCEYLVVPSGSSVNLTCKVRNFRIMKNWCFSNESLGLKCKEINEKSKTLTLSQVKKSHSGNYTCITLRKSYYGQPLYTFVLKVNTKETSQEKDISHFSLPPVTSAPDLVTRVESTPSLTASTMVTTREKSMESVPSVPNFTKVHVKQNKTLVTTSKKKATVSPTNEDFPVEFKVKGEKEKTPNSIATRANCTFNVLVLLLIASLYIYTFTEIAALD